MRYSLYTDGACQPNPGVGGWAFVLIAEDENSYIHQGSAPATTNNRMELSAVLHGFRMFLDIREPDDELTLYSDSMYLINGVMEWSIKWKKNNWKRGKISDPQPVLNVDLWKSIREVADQIHIQSSYVPGHSGHVYNEIVDKLAVEMIAKYGLLPNTGN